MHVREKRMRNAIVERYALSHERNCDERGGAERGKRGVIDTKLSVWLNALFSFSAGHWLFFRHADIPPTFYLPYVQTTERSRNRKRVAGCAINSGYGKERLGHDQNANSHLYEHAISTFLAISIWCLELDFCRDTQSRSSNIRANLRVKRCWNLYEYK